MKPRQLEDLIERFLDATGRRPLTGIEGGPWDLKHAGATLKSIQKRYAQKDYQLEMLGLPLLAYLTLRLVAESPKDAQKVVGDTTSLYRSLVDLVVQKAGKPDHARARAKDEPVITGDDLRRLLQDTAAAMTALDVRNISRDELKIRLGKSFEQLDREVRAFGEEQVLGRLLISFFFKGGHPELGCEFSHKSFREYLFAEKIVERLKAYGRQARPGLPPRVSEGEPYWKDFSPGMEGDERYELSRDLLGHLGPQWLQPEERGHIRKLLAWEIGRAKGSASESRLGRPTEPLKLADWNSIRDGLADLWDWWGEGVHLRPLPQMHRRGSGIEYQKPLAVEHAEDTIWRSRHDTIQTPIRVITLDGHFGDALFALCSFVHAQLIDQLKQTVTTGRKSARTYQTTRQGEGTIYFAPSGKISDQFRTYISRINACGFRPGGSFPWASSCACLDLSATNLAGINLFSSDLAGADFSSANLYRATLSYANLQFANLSGAHLIDSDITSALLSGANLSRATLSNSDLSHSNLTGADLSHSELSNADLTGTNLYRAIITNKALQSTTGVPSRLPDGTIPQTKAEYHAWLEKQLSAETSQKKKRLTPPTRPE